MSEDEDLPYGLRHPEKSAATLQEMAERLGVDIVNDGRAYSIICTKLLERIEELEESQEKPVDYDEPIDEITDMLADLTTKLDWVIARLERLENTIAVVDGFNADYKELWDRLKRLEKATGKVPPLPHWTDMPR